jgi:hypothetical protein
LASTALITTRRRWIIGLLLACFVLACIRFALVQDIWIDESTQLSGVRLPVAELLGWLGGTDANRFGVPGDRMPPMAYLLDHLWWDVSGDAVTRFRMFHILLTTAGVALLAWAEIKALGPRWLGIGTAFLVLSPKLIEAAVELRSYALLFTVTCALVPLFLDIVKRDENPVDWRKLLMFGGGCIILCYSHFFGVVAAFSFFATLLLAFCRDRASLLRVLIVGAGLALCLMGLYPFVFGAATLSASATPAAHGGIGSYLPLLFGHPALLLYPIAALLYFAGCGVLLLAAAYGIVLRAVRRSTEPADWLLVVTLIGCAATILPSFVISAFSALKPSYSIWLFPILAMLIALGASKPLGWLVWDRYGRAGAVAALLAGAALATGVFLARAPWFVHGPHRVIETAREQSPPATAIVYAQPASFAYGYFPMVYQSGGHLQQWLVMPGGVGRLGVSGISTTLPLTALAPYRGLVVVDIRPRHYSDLRHCLDGHCPTFPGQPLVDQLVHSGNWSVVSRHRAFGFYDAVVTRLMPRAPI